MKKENFVALERTHILYPLLEDEIMFYKPHSAFTASSLDETYNFFPS